MAKDVRTTASSWGVASSAYEKFSEDFSDALYHCVQRLDPQKGEVVLDVATGTGWTARLAAARGAKRDWAGFQRRSYRCGARDR
jgi:cyclopropane fatty-acyl-phospholipid synthase-like methyltransferase